MNSRGNEQAIDPERRCTLQIGADRVADGKDAPVSGNASARIRSKLQRLLVNGSVRLAGIDHRAARGRVKIGNSARTIEKFWTSLDHDVRIGANHWQFAG